MNGLCPGVDAARAHLAVFGPGGYQPLAKLGDGAVPVLIKPAGCEVLPRRTVVVGLQTQRQPRSPHAVWKISLTW